MKVCLKITLFFVIAILFSACAKTETPSDINIDKSSIAVSFATVEAVDLKNRLVTLQPPEGATFTIHAGEEVVNLPQVVKGDRVEVIYLQSLIVRMAEPGENRDDTTVFSTQAEPGSKPSTLKVKETNITATIHEIDTVNETATLKMEDNSYQVIKVQDPANLDKVKVGDRIAITLQEAVEIKVKGNDQ